MSSERGSDFPDEDVVQSRCNSIIKTKDNRFLNMLLTTDGNSFMLTLFDRF